jgi:hypothetical protein
MEGVFSPLFLFFFLFFFLTELLSTGWKSHVTLTGHTHFVGPVIQLSNGLLVSGALGDFFSPHFFHLFFFAQAATTR